MKSLKDLRSDWFLNFDSPKASFPKADRHKNSNVLPWTDGNKVEPLIDGESFMKKWHETMEKLKDEEDAKVFLSAWKLNRVRLLGKSKPDSNAEKILIDSNAQLFPLICGNAGNYLSLELSLQPGNARITEKLNANGILNACLDRRYPTRSGSNHAKFSVFLRKHPQDSTALLGSIDIAVQRWDTDKHLPTNHERPRAPTHDVGVLVQGPAVTDLAWSFIERWNDVSRKGGMRRFAFPRLPGPILEATEDPAPKIADIGAASEFSQEDPGSLSIQVLHTYGKAIPKEWKSTYSWSDVGEFSAWASHLNAIKKAESYIYIEDQYFFPFNFPPMTDDEFKGTDGQKSDIIFQLGEALERGVKVAVIVPSVAEDIVVWRYQEFQRKLATHYLRTISMKPDGPAWEYGGEFIIGTLANGDTPIYVHSKLMICDDEFVSIGSVNINQRSMTHDGELQIGIVDADNKFPRELREALWQEHTGENFINNPDMEDPEAAFSMLKLKMYEGEGSDNKNNRLRSLFNDLPGPVPEKQKWWINEKIDPYRGPNRKP